MIFYEKKGVITGQEMRRLFQLDQPGGLLDICLTTVEEQNDGLSGGQVPRAEY
jgi:hypothetical protein